MQAHFTSFTPGWTHAFGQELATQAQRCREFLDNTRKHTHAFLADFRGAHEEATEHAADGRRLFVSDLRSDVHALLNRFELIRGEMADELRAASEAFRSRPTAQAGFFSRHAATHRSASRRAEVSGSRADFKGQKGTKRSGHSKKRRG